MRPPNPGSRQNGKVLSGGTPKFIPQGRVGRVKRKVSYLEKGCKDLSAFLKIMSSSFSSLDVAKNRASRQFLCRNNEVLYQEELRLLV